MWVSRQILCILSGFLVLPIKSLPTHAAILAYGQEPHHHPQATVRSSFENSQSQGLLVRVGSAPELRRSKSFGGIPKATMEPQPQQRRPTRRTVIRNGFDPGNSLISRPLATLSTGIAGLLDNWKQQQQPSQPLLETRSAPVVSQKRGWVSVSLDSCSDNSFVSFPSQNSNKPSIIGKLMWPPIKHRNSLDYAILEIDSVSFSKDFYQGILSATQNELGRIHSSYLFGSLHKGTQTLKVVLNGSPQSPMHGQFILTLRAFDDENGWTEMLCLKGTYPSSL